MKNKVYIVRNELEGYNACKNALKDVIQEYKQVIYNLVNVRGVSFDRIVVENSEKRFNYELLRKKDNLEKEMLHLNNRIKFVENFINSLDDEEKEIIISHYIENKNYGFLEKKYNLTNKQIRRKIEKIIEKNVK